MQNAYCLVNDPPFEFINYTSFFPVCCQLHQVVSCAYLVCSLYSVLGTELYMQSSQFSEKGKEKDGQRARERERERKRKGIRIYYLHENRLPLPLKIHPNHVQQPSRRKQEKDEVEYGVVAKG